MSTRCIIRIEGIEFAAIYKHCDGYPDGTVFVTDVKTGDAHDK